MKTTEMCSTLRAFAELARADRAEGLRKFASAFGGGKDETVAARVKRIAKRWTTGSGHPPTLKESLTTIAEGFSASNAKQAGDFHAILSLFQGSGADTSVDTFVTRLAEVLVAADTRAPTRRTTQQPDQRLVSELADGLARTLLDEVAFSKVMDRLRDPKSVSTPTLGAVANRFLGNDRRYSGRKAAIDDIAKRQQQDARAHARGKALDRIGV